MGKALKNAIRLESNWNTFLKEHPEVEPITDSYGNIHAMIGKVNFDEEKLVENLKSFVEAIIKVKPTTVKGTYIKNISVSSTMGPGIKLDLNSIDK